MARQDENKAFSAVRIGCDDISPELAELLGTSDFRFPSQPFANAMIHAINPACNDLFVFTATIEVRDPLSQQEHPEEQVEAGEEPQPQPQPGAQDHIQALNAPSLVNDPVQDVVPDIENTGSEADSNVVFPRSSQASDASPDNDEPSVLKKVRFGIKCVEAGPAEEIELVNVPSRSYIEPPAISPRPVLLNQILAGPAPERRRPRAEANLPVQTADPAQMQCWY